MLRFFESLLSQSVSPGSLEIIFINQGNFKPPIEMLASRGIFFREINTGRLPLSRARNIGLAEVNGDLIGFPDDDCWYPPTLLAKVLEYFHEHPLTSALSTNVFDPNSGRSYGGRPVGVHARIVYKNLFVLPTSVGIFVRKNAFEAAGFYFDDLLGAGTPLGSGEEIDLVYRLLKCGALVEYLGTMKVFHPVNDYQEDDIEKYRLYGLGFGYLNGVIIRDGEYRVLPYFFHVVHRSLGGSILNIYKSTKRKVYWYRFLGICEGFWLGLRGSNVNS